MKTKYIAPFYVEAWKKVPIKPTTNTYVTNNLTFPNVRNWLCWKVGNKIVRGFDCGIENIGYHIFR